MFTEIISIENMQFDGDVLTVDAIVDEARLVRRETEWEPAEYGPGLCRGTLLFSDDTLIPATDAELLVMLGQEIDDWELVPTDDDWRSCDD